MANLTNLVSVPTLVESPFIIAHIGNYSFGSYSAVKFGNGVKVNYPNFMDSIEITKVNGTVNTYVLNFTYQVPPGGDPNLLDAIFSSAANDRRVVLEYGDWNSPSYIYKEEVCIITNLTTSLDMNSSCIKYSMHCTSDAIGLASMSYDFPARKAKPSDVLKQMLKSSQYGLRNVFSSMQGNADALIASDDKEVELLAQHDVTPLEYMNYLVQSMISYSNTGSSALQNSIYTLSIHDDRSSNYSGTYFKVTKVDVNTRTLVTPDTYEVDVNYPGDNFVTQFSLNNDQSWSLLYEFSEDLKQDEYVYSVAADGTVRSEYVPNLVKSANSTFSAAKSSWWTKMTQFPIQATLTIKGLTRPSILMSYVKLNVWFAGSKKHVSSGLYIITKQVDTINASGYRTTLTLLRVGGD